jgi:hypothetical protein
VVVCIAAFVMLTVWGASFSFWHDDWKFLDTHTGGLLDALVKPFNGHWKLPVVAYHRLLLETVGLSAYWPYLLPLTVAHLATAAALYWGGRHLAGPAAGLVAGVLMLSLGPAGILLFMSQALDFLGAVAFGSWALMLVIVGGRRRLVAAAVLLVLAIASGGMGLAFLAATVALLVLTPGRWRDLWVAGPAIVIYGVWYLAFGRSAISLGFQPTLGGMLDMADYVTRGATAATGWLSGLGPEVGAVLIVVLVAATIWQLLGRGPYVYVAIAALAGLIALYVLVALSGIGVSARQPDAPRYAYGAVALILTALLSWYGLMSRRRPANALPLLIVALWAISANAVHLRWFAEEWVPEQLDKTHATYQIIVEHGGSERLPGGRDIDHPDGFVSSFPSPDRVGAIVDRFGEPVGGLDVAVPEELVRQLEAELLDQVGD